MVLAPPRVLPRSLALSGVLLGGGGPVPVPPYLAWVCGGDGRSRIMENVKELFWCDARDEQGHLQHAPDCEQRDCFVVQGKKQETNTGAKGQLPDHYRCTITCAFCGKRKHYEEECYHKQRLSAKLKGEDPGKGSRKGGGKGEGNDSSKGKSKGRGQGQDKSQGGRGGGASRQPDKDNENPDKNGGNPNPNPGGNSEPSGGSLVRPHAHKRRPSKNKGLSVSMKAVMTATLRREAVS